MTQAVSGRRVGSRAFEDPGRELATKQEAVATGSGRAGIEKREWRVCKGDLIAARKPFEKSRSGKNSARVDKVASPMHTAPGFKAAVEKQRDGASLPRTCGAAAAPLLNAACNHGQKRKDREFPARHRPAQAQAIAQEQYAGRDYTAVMSGPCAAPCRKCAAHGADAVAAAKEGVTSSFKKLLPF